MVAVDVLGRKKSWVMVGYGGPRVANRKSVVRLFFVYPSASAFGFRLLRFRPR